MVRRAPARLRHPDAGPGGRADVRGAPPRLRGVPARGRRHRGRSAMAPDGVAAGTAETRAPAADHRARAGGSTGPSPALASARGDRGVGAAAGGRLGVGPLADRGPAARAAGSGASRGRAARHPLDHAGGPRAPGRRGDGRCTRRGADLRRRSHPPLERCGPRAAARAGRPSLPVLVHLRGRDGSGHRRRTRAPSGPRCSPPACRSRRPVPRSRVRRSPRSRRPTAWVRRAARRSRT